jgi:hypothetical protein
MHDQTLLQFSVNFWAPGMQIAPFRWHSVSTEEFERKQGLLKEAFSELQQIKVNYTDVHLSAMEDFIARGDRCALLWSR